MSPQNLIYLPVPNFYLYHANYRHTSVVYYYTFFAFLPTITTTVSGVVNINNIKGLNGCTCPNPVGLGIKRFAMPVVKTSLTTSLAASHQLPSKRFFFSFSLFFLVYIRSNLLMKAAMTMLYPCLNT